MVVVVTRASGGRASRPRVPGPEATKRLVAHHPTGSGAVDSWYGPHDGEPVDLPAPCVRVRAGYWCPCGASFIGTATWETTHLARVVPLDHGVVARYIDDRDDGYEAPVPQVSEEDRATLVAQIEAMPIGTVVERHGTGIARRFGDTGTPVVTDGSEEWPF